MLVVVCASALQCVEPTLIFICPFLQTLEAAVQEIDNFAEPGDASIIVHKELQYLISSCHSEINKGTPAACFVS